MDFTRLFNRIIEHVWRRKFLVVIGTLIALLSGEGLADGILSRLVGQLYASLGITLPPPFAPAGDGLFASADTQAVFAWLVDNGMRGAILLTVLVLFVMAILLTLVLILYGAMIAGVGHLERGEVTGFGRAVRQGWRRAWHLLIAASLPPIPITIAANLIVIGWWVFIAATGVSRLGETLGRPGVAPGLLLSMIVIMLPFGLASFFLAVLWPVAARACVLDDMRAVESFRRSWAILKAQPGPVILLLLIEGALRTALSTVLLLPRLAAMVCVAALPVVWVLSGVEKALASALWTVWYESQATSHAPSMAE